MKTFRYLSFLLLFVALIHSRLLANPPRVYATTLANPSGPPDQVATKIMDKPIYPLAVHVVAFSPDGSTLGSGDGMGKLRLWDPASGSLRHQVAAHSNWVFSISWTKDGAKVITGGGDNLIQWFDARAPGASVRTFRAHSNDVHAVVLTRDGKTLYSTGDDRQIVAWDVEQGAARRRFAGHARQIPTLALAPDEKLLASGSRDHSIVLWDTRTGLLRDTLVGHTADVVSLAFSPEGALLASAGWDYTVRLWDAKNGKAVRVLLGHPNWVSSVAFSPNGKRLASSSGGQLRVVDVATGNEIWTTEFKGRITGAGGDALEDLSAVVFSPDGKTIAVGSTNGSVYIVLADTGELLKELKPPKT
jgi:WD40 repeat protein